MAIKMNMLKPSDEHGQQLYKLDMPCCVTSMEGLGKPIVSYARLAQFHCSFTSFGDIIEAKQ